MQQARIASPNSNNTGSFTNYGINQLNPLSQNFNYLNSDLQRVTVAPRDCSRDPLAIAERGKVGIPSSHSECSSNDSIEASIDSHTGILSGEKKGIKLFKIFNLVLLIILFFAERHPSISKNSDISNTTSIRDSRIDGSSEVATKSIRYQRISNAPPSTTAASTTISPPRQDSLDDVPNIQCNSNSINNNNEDVSNIDLNKYDHLIL